ncbi:ribosomal protein S18 acetylase RimI-like enzyme [Streptomyces sp. SAI-135]|uniref:GNAT family N-acetyltransferase n=1 Tax=unclassified Streptomyces TaxID=2593676 RepID=UPI002476DAD7|nr:MULTISPECIES: GNAT family N-acetyltransferase [unclassified Streptomyces]MDH6515004.1 ribosomal protein S18 acetylase RimI-like enzyme [Streptomyces sp. SAI-090]MDH6620912.1 ribosomal protein S18 acetylase RimI-like enzyme [Streptomyces sp. SAI-135]
MAQQIDVRGGGASLRLTAPDTSVLDNAVWAALTGPHAHLADRVGRAARYPDDVYAVAALADPGDPAAWADLLTLVGPGTTVRIKPVDRVPDGWEVVGGGVGVQLVDTALRAEPAPEAVRLGPDDVPEILDLVARTRPGPFRRRTIALGTYLGIRDRGRLIALAGERLRPPGWTEISAVCTDPAHRGRGLATRLVRAVAAGIRERGDTPFLHAAPDNTNAIRLYESIGFTRRLRSPVLLVRSPGTSQESRVL